MNAAIYCRKSTVEENVAEEAKSVVRQEANARTFALAKGWTVEQVYVDDGISGAETRRLINRQRLLDVIATGHPPFQALIMRDTSRFSRRDGDEAFAELKAIANAGVEIWFYSDGTKFTHGDLGSNVVGFVRAEMNAEFRRQISKWTREAMLRKAKAGHVTGGRVFGYDNVRICAACDHPNPSPGSDQCQGCQRLLKGQSHVDRKINPVEAKVIKRIFALYDAGEGLKNIGKQLTIDGAPSPRPFQSTTADALRAVVGWSPSTVNAILQRQMYHGVYEWNKTEWYTIQGRAKQRPRPKAEWLSIPIERWRIVNERLWVRVASRRTITEGKAARFASGHLSGRPPKHTVVNLLAGMAMCSLCGGGMVVQTSPRKRGRVPEYGCHRHRMNGSCPNAMHVPVADANEAVLAAVEEFALTPAAIEQVILLSECDDTRERQLKLERERLDVAKRITRLVTAIEDGNDSASVLTKLRTLELRQIEIETDLTGLRPVPRLASKVIEGRLAEWRRLLRQSTTQARTVLQRVIVGRITFAPRADGNGWDFSAPTRFDKLFAGVRVPLEGVASPRPSWMPHGPSGVENPHDEDYGKLLDAFYVKGVASPIYASWNQLDGWLRAVDGLRRAA